MMNIEVNLTLKKKRARLYLGFSIGKFSTEKPLESEKICRSKSNLASRSPERC